MLANTVSGIQAALQASSNGKIFCRGKRKYRESYRYMVKDIGYFQVSVYLVLGAIRYTRGFRCIIYRKQAYIQYCFILYIIL